GLVEVLVDQRHRTDSISAIGEQLGDYGVCDPLRLQTQQTADQLQIVLDAVVNFLQQGILLLKGRALQRQRGLAGQQLQQRDSRRSERVGRQVVLQIQYADEVGLLQERQAENRTAVSAGKVLV